MSQRSKQNHELLGVMGSPYLEGKQVEDGKLQLDYNYANQLKKDLITRSIQSESEYLFNNNFIRVLRESNSADEQGSLKGTGNEPKGGEVVNTPIMRYFFNNYLLTFPFLANTDIPKFLDKLELFFDEVVAAKLSTDAENADTTKRRLLVIRIQKILVLIFNNATPIRKDNLIKGDSLTSTPTSPEVKEIKVEEKPKTDSVADTKPENLNSILGTPYRVNIAGVRKITVKGTFTNSVHPEFIVSLLKIGDDKTLYTLKKYSDFKTLLKKISKRYPLLDLPALPPKLKDSPKNTNLYSEGDRLNLRSVLRRLLALPEVTSLPEIYQFLTDDPIVLEKEDTKDILERENHMQQLSQERRKFHLYVSEKAAKYNSLWITCKQELFKPGGIEEFEKMLSTTSTISELPEHFRGVMEWARLNFASFLYTFFCTTDDSARFFKALCSTHGIVPYRTLATILQYTNPTYMVKGVMDLLLSQPFGSTSLMQRLLTTSLLDQARNTQTEIDGLEAKVQDPELCQRIRNFVYNPESRSETSALTEDISNFDRLTTIINDPEIQPELTPESIMRFWAAREWIDKYNSGQNPPVAVGPNGELLYNEFLFLETLHQLFILQTRKRDTEKISDLMFQGSTGKVMKELLTIFYGPLAQVYRDANVGDYVMKISHFIDDMIQVIGSVNSGDYVQNSESGQLQAFIDLVARHEEVFYSFVHSIYSHTSSSLFRDLLKWFDSLFDTIRNHVIEGELDMQALVDTKLPSHLTNGLKSDLQELVAYNTRRKQRQMRNLRNKINLATGQDLDATEELEENNEEVIGKPTRSNSTTDFGFGNLSLDDIRDIQELDSLDTSNFNDQLIDPSTLSQDEKSRLELNKAHSQAQLQSQINADPSQPMLIWLNDTLSTAGSESEKASRSSAEIVSSTNEKGDNFSPNLSSADIPQRIQKFVTAKELVQISQEPYPTNIFTVPLLLNPFTELLETKLKK